MRFSDGSRRQQTQFVVGAVLVVFGLLMLLGAYTAWMGVLFTWFRRLSRFAVPIALIAIGVYVIWGVRRHAFDAYLGTQPRPRVPLSRSHDDFRIAGVCGGIAQYFGIESMFVRVLAVLLAFASPLLTLIAYVVLAIVLSRG